MKFAHARDGSREGVYSRIPDWRRRFVRAAWAGVALLLAAVALLRLR